MKKKSKNFSNIFQRIGTKESHRYSALFSKKNNNKQSFNTNNNISGNDEKKNYLWTGLMLLAVVIIIIAILVGVICSQPKYSSNAVYVNMIRPSKANKKTVMLTFDDGPLDYSPKTASRGVPGDSPYDPEDDLKPGSGRTVDDEILDILEKYKAYSVDGKSALPGTFFEIGSHINTKDPSSPNKNSNDIKKSMTRIIKTGSWIGSHSYNHDHYAKKSKNYFFDDIKKSYETVDNFYKEYYKNEGYDVNVSKDSISKLNITKDTQTQTIDIPLRLGYLQDLPWEKDFVKKFNIKQLICGYIGTDWNETKNASDTDAERVFKKNHWGDWNSLKDKYSNGKNANDPGKKDFYNHAWQALVSVTKKDLLNEYEPEVNKIDKLDKHDGVNYGLVFTLHTRKFAKYWLPDFIDYLHKDGYTFVGMNPYSSSYYANYGELMLSTHRHLND